MSEEITGDGVPNPDAGGNKAVSFETYDRLVKQRKADQEKLRELTGRVEKLSDFEAKLKEIEAKEAEASQKKLEEEGKWREALEHKNKMLKDLEEKFKNAEAEKESTKKALLDSAKIQAVVDKLPGRIKRNEYLNFIDIDQVILDPETGDFDESSIGLVANNFLKNHSELIQVEGSKKLPGDAAKGGAPLTAEAWKALPLAEKKKRLKEVVPK